MSRRPVLPGDASRDAHDVTVRMDRVERRMNAQSRRATSEQGVHGYWRGQGEPASFSAGAWPNTASTANYMTSFTISSSGVSLPVVAENELGIDIVQGGHWRISAHVRVSLSGAGAPIRTTAALVTDPDAGATGGQAAMQPVDQGGSTWLANLAPTMTNYFAAGTNIWVFVNSLQPSHDGSIWIDEFSAEWLGE